MPSALLPYTNDADDADAARGAVQINGVDVRTREQAIQMFAENRDDITLLLARPTTQVCEFAYTPLYTVSQKICHLMFVNNFGKRRPIFKFLSPTDLLCKSSLFNPLMGTRDYNTATNNMKLVRSPLGAQAPLRCTKCTRCNSHPSTVSVPITVLLYSGLLLCGFNVPVKGLTAVCAIGNGLNIGK